MLELLSGFAAGAVVATIVWVILIYAYSDRLVHRIRYKKYTLPCPACRDENDKPTGKVTPKNPYLQQMGGAELTFDCSTCDGAKEIVYEFPRGQRVEINDRQMLEGASPDQPRPRRRGLFG